MKLSRRVFQVAFSKYQSMDVQKFDYAFEVIPNSIHYWMADPFPIEVDGKLYIFAEMMEHRTGKGALAYCCKNEQGFSKWKKIIEESYHLSFPNIFYIKDTLFICAETCQNGCISLFRCESFPDKWVKIEETIMKGKYADTIFYSCGGEDYGFTYNLETKRMDVFKIVYNEGLVSRGQIKGLGSDYERPGGKIFFDEKLGDYLMPGQIGKPYYGSGLVFKKFSLTWPDYQEQKYTEVFPQNIRINIQKELDGMHTFNISENYVVIDVAYDGVNLIEVFYRILRKIGLKKEYEFD